MKKEEFEKLLSFLKLTLDEKSKKAMSPGDKLAVFLLFAFFRSFQIYIY
jgi:hypothetical protein